jgi:phage repressor protein C with HTH and peptisase S24 domain
MGIIDRIRQYLDFKGISDYRFEKELSLSKGYINKAKNPTSDVLMKICGIYTDISPEWLVTGKGEMIKNTEREQKTIEISESAISETKRKGALIYDIDATCGLSGRDVDFTDEKVIGSIDAPEINPDSKIIFATGDSMLPLIASGDRVVIRKIESWDYFNYGQVYLIITNEYRLIKRIRRHPKDSDNLILLRSENPDYDDIDLPKREIIHLFIVENILSIKNIL